MQLITKRLNNPFAKQSPSQRVKKVSKLRQAAF